ncbi:MAG: ribonuclease H [Hyphomonadaceae bacterium]
MKRFPLRGLFAEQWMQLPDLSGTAEGDYASVIAQCITIRRRMLQRMSERLPSEPHRTQERVTRRYFLSEPARVATLYDVLRRRRVEFGVNRWCYRDVVELGRSLDVFHPSSEPIRVGGVHRRNGSTRTIFCLSHLDCARHRLASDALTATMRLHPRLFMYSGGERSLRRWLEESLPRAQVVLTTDFPDFFLSLSRERLTGVTPLPGRVTKALLEAPLVNTTPKDANHAQHRGVIPSGLSRRVLCWSSLSDWLSAQPTCAQALRDGWGIPPGSPLSQIASQALLHDILVKLENAAGGIEVGCWADNLIIPLRDASAKDAVTKALGQAVRDVIRDDCQKELLGRISADNPRDGFEYLRYRVQLTKNEVCFSASHSDWEGMDNRLLDEIDLHDEDTVVERALCRMRPLVNDVACLQYPLRAAYRAGALLGDPPLSPPSPSFDPEIEIYSDGAAEAGGGCGGWAAIIVVKDCVHELQGGLPLTTNNEMELLAVVSALESLNAPTRVHLITDSRYVEDGVRRLSQRQKTWRTISGKKLAHLRLWRRMAAQLERHEVFVEWVRGHGLCEGNVRADALAKSALATEEAKRHRWDTKDC